MDEAWIRAIDAALEGQTADSSSASRSLTLDGAMKCALGQLPPPELFEKYQSLEHLSIADIGVSSLERFPRLRNLQRLILSDNRISGGLEFLVEAGLDSLRDLDLSNNRIQFLEDLAPLARLRLVSLDLYECPVTKIADYRSKVFGMIRSLKYLDKMDSDENERPESDEEEEEDEEDEEDEDDPGSGEIDGEDKGGKMANGVANGRGDDGIVDVDEDDESDADEEETEIGRPEVNGSARCSHQHMTNGFRLAPIVAEEDDDDEDEDVEYEDDDDEDLGEEIDEEEGEDEDIVEVHDIADSDDDEGDGVEEEVDLEDDVDEDEEDVEDEEDDAEPYAARIPSTDGEIDGHDQGEDDENGQIGEDDGQGVEEDDGEDEDEDDDTVGDYVMHRIPRTEGEMEGGCLDACNGEDEDGVEDDDEDDADCVNGDLPHHTNGPSSSSLPPSKRKRGSINDEGLDKDSKSPKHH